MNISLHWWLLKKELVYRDESEEEMGSRRGEKEVRGEYLQEKFIL